MENFQKQAERSVDNPVRGRHSLELEGDVKKVTIGSGETFLAHAVIISTGSAYRELGFADEKRLPATA